MITTQQRRRVFKVKSARPLLLASLIAVTGCRGGLTKVERFDDTFDSHPTIQTQPPESQRLAGHPSDESEVVPADVHLVAFQDGEEPADLTAPADQQDIVTLDSLIANALATHPSIAAARQKVAAAQHRVPQATALEDPMLGNTFWPIHDQALQTAGGRVGHQFALTQKLP
ncbi:hypothetical protein [Stieleria magnilauensis]|uniref:Uncharacterized protein n=1 Tax=Stieleria magnilauensis TaxID=2527963 RepID=A0ABX5XKS5_9BACT|nr:hypothetical protein TBK1r_12190 [Planctomycetes bacterium TBK1r]